MAFIYMMEFYRWWIQRGRHCEINDWKNIRK